MDRSPLCKQPRDHPVILARGGGDERFSRRVCLNFAEGHLMMLSRLGLNGATAEVVMSE
jgi:hypothetical protein